jgi:hypothetical protein
MKKRMKVTTPERTFTVKEAAEYLGISISGVKFFHYRMQTLQGEKRGNSLIFKQSELDSLQAARHVGRRTGKPGAASTAAAPGKGRSPRRVQAHPAQTGEIK